MKDCQSKTMMYTEEEAQNKWCPLYRMTATSDAFNGPEWHSNRGAMEPNHEVGASRCIGSACMAWRWEQRKRDTSDGNINATRIDYGYCGAFGEPK